MALSDAFRLNWAVALAMRDGPTTGIAAIDAILARGELDGYHLAHAARADLLRRAGRSVEARKSYERALELALQEPERRLIQRRSRSWAGAGMARQGQASLMVLV